MIYKNNQQLIIFHLNRFSCPFFIIIINTKYISVYLHLSIYLSYLSIYLSYLSIYLSHLSIYLIYLSVSSIYLISFYLSILSLSICQSYLYLSIYLSICLSIYLIYLIYFIYLIYLSIYIDILYCGKKTM